MILLIKDGIDFLYFVILPSFSGNETVSGLGQRFRALDHGEGHVLQYNTDRDRYRNAGPDPKLLRIAHSVRSRN